MVRLLFVTFWLLANYNSSILPLKKATAVMGLLKEQQGVFGGL
jgi:hypothetical protein